MKLNFKRNLKWFKKKISWNYKYSIGKWDFMDEENLRYSKIVDLIKGCEFKNLKILDLGCGYGSLNKYLKGVNYEFILGVDLSSNAISRAKKESFINSKFIVSDIQQFTPEEKFDIIIFNEVLYYLDDQMKILRRYSKYLNDGGYFIFSFYGIREDLIQEISEEYQLKRKEVVKQSEKVFWGITLFKVDSPALRSLPTS
ncbi:class I SAM-dependent methyltransferase [Flavobacterium aciduliphilum]|uniref:Methyltransferase family protein n=1 Tax=Flavobacterium aciduliphilum TaxID=1101402 RepID=A0A328YPF2_9FLAO|nr:class I SAM-dependent methyltransferase [Flavobacterium aciduliphilum]RAR75470.1 methyltransferase family protein [Flavobacterium aciduliphilum]